MRQMAGCINKALNERSNRYQQSREKKHRVNGDAETDCRDDGRGERAPPKEPTPGLKKVAHVPSTEPPGRRLCRNGV